MHVREVECESETQSQRVDEHLMPKAAHGIRVAETLSPRSAQSSQSHAFAITTGPNGQRIPVCEGAIDQEISRR